MIYDAFCFSGELSLLKIRCAELKPLNVIHVLVESKFTFSGKPKPLIFDQHKDEFKEYPIIHVIVDRIPDVDPWKNEAFQRDACMSALQGLNDDDVVIIADVDEIVKAGAVHVYRPEQGFVALEMDLFYFYLNVLGSHAAWRIAKMLPWSILKNTTPNAIRNAGADGLIKNAGYHFTYQGGVNAMIEKFASFSHQEEAVQKHGKPDVLQYKFANLESLFGEDRYSTVPISELPQYVQDHQEEFKEMLYVS